MNRISGFIIFFYCSACFAGIETWSDKTVCRLLEANPDNSEYLSEANSRDLGCASPPAKDIERTQVSRPFEGVTRPKTYRNSKIAITGVLNNIYPITTLPDRAMIISDPDDQEPHYLRMTLKSGDCATFMGGSFNDCDYMNNGRFTNERVVVNWNSWVQNGDSKEGKTYYYGFKIRLDEDTWQHARDDEAPFSTNLFQWYHNNTGATFNIMYSNKYHDYHNFPDRPENVLYIDLRGRDLGGRYCEYYGSKERDALRTVLVENPLGNWINFVVKARFSTKDDGFFAIWANGIKKFEHRGKNLCIKPGKTKASGKAHNALFIYRGTDQRWNRHLEQPATFPLPTLITDFTGLVREEKVNVIKKHYSISEEMETLTQRQIPKRDYWKNEGTCLENYRREDIYCVEQPEASPLYDGLYDISLFRDKKSIGTATINIIDGKVTVKDKGRWVHRKIDDPFSGAYGTINDSGDMTFSMNIDPWNKGKWLKIVTLKGSLVGDSPLSGFHDSTLLKLTIKPKE